MGDICEKCGSAYTSSAGLYLLNGQGLCHSCFWRDRLNQHKTATQVATERPCQGCNGLFMNLYSLKGVDLCSECYASAEASSSKDEYPKQCGLCYQYNGPNIIFQDKLICNTCSLMIIQIGTAGAKLQKAKAEKNYDNLTSKKWKASSEYHSSDLINIVEITDSSPTIDISTYRHYTKLKIEDSKTVEPNHIPLEKKGRKLNLDDL